LKKRGTPDEWEGAEKEGGVGGICRGAISSPNVIIVIIIKKKGEK